MPDRRAQTVPNDDVDMPGVSLYRYVIGSFEAVEDMWDVEVEGGEGGEGRRIDMCA